MMGQISDLIPKNGWNMEAKFVSDETATKMVFLA